MKDLKTLLFKETYYHFKEYYRFKEQYGDWDDLVAIQRKKERRRCQTVAEALLFFVSEQAQQIGD